jgi:phenylacetyl-CoA:acceptor oxidoreductase subunit 2
MKFGYYLQPNWDWRAAGNFMFGGTGGALILLTALSTWPHSPPLPLSLSALALIGLGLFLVWLEIGRPWRFLHVFFHPQTSWMTREASIAMVLFPIAIAGIFLGSNALLAAAGLLGLVFLYCQGRILRAATGIPAWREPAVVPLIISTGLAEGAGVLLIIACLLDSVRDVYLLAIAVLLLLRGILWTRYRSALERNQAPAGAQDRFKAIHVPFLWFGNALPLALVLIPFVAPLDWLIPLAALLVLFAGWHMKFVLVARAAFVQGYGVGKLRRGRPEPRKPVRRQGDPWRA